MSSPSYISPSSIRQSSVTPKRSCQGGFALVIALSLMAFILLLLLSITTLVSVETASADISKSKLAAQQNALMSAYVALGELQRTAGKDQRVTARADILAASAPSKKHVTGVWSTEPATAGQAIAWLASDWDRVATDYATQPAPGLTDADTVILVGEGSTDATADPDDLVRVSTLNTQIQGANVASGRYAWWVSDENTKAMIRPSSDSSVAGGNEERFSGIKRAAAKDAADLGVLAAFSGDSVTAEDLSKVSDISSLAVAGFDVDGLRQHFHDYTANSFGVLSNTRDGGLKRDLSLAFEMRDADFAASEFAAGGPSPVPVLGTSIRAQPMFRDTNGGRGPSWHLLRDYYTIYQRMENPLTDPTFPAQHFLPNHDELGVPAGLDNDLAALRFDNRAVSESTNGDPLLSDSLPYLIRAHYAPYIQRWIQTFGLLFSPAPAGEGLDPTISYVIPRVYVNPVGVYHNPYNVKVEHYGYASVINQSRFNVLLKADDLGPDLEVFYRNDFRPPAGFRSVRSTNVFTGTNSFMLKVPPGTMAGGQSEVYYGMPVDASGFSVHGTPVAEDFFPVGAFNGSGEGPGIASVRIPEIAGPDVEVDFAPFGSFGGGGAKRWPVFEYHSMGSSTRPVTAGVRRDSGFTELYNYAAFAEDWTIRQTNEAHRTWLNNPNPFGSDDYVPSRDGIFMDTAQFREGTGDAPKPYLTLDNYLKATDDSQAFPVYALSNPHAPMKGSSNLLSDQEGHPVFCPAWRMTISQATLAPGEALLQSANPGSDNGRNAYWGTSYTAGGALSVAPLELPVTPPISLGQLQSANLAVLGTMPALAVGNSYATPYLARNQIAGQFQNFRGENRLYHDLSYHLNSILWDSYFFSSYSVPYDLSDDFDVVANRAGQSFDQAFDPSSALANLYQGSLPNPRMKLLLSDEETLSDAKAKVFDSSNAARPTGVARSAENLIVEGAFNVNSTSEEAWAALLAAGRGRDVFKSDGSTDTGSPTATPASRSLLPSDSAFAGDISSDEAWSGYRSLTDAQIRRLAAEIVAELKDRVQAEGQPFLSLSSFVNRKLSNDAFGLAGLLQAAIDRSGLNADFAALPADYGTFPASTNLTDDSGDVRNPALGAAAQINQADILAGIGSFIQVRSDTFKIRTYGDVRDPVGGQITSRAWCEMIVQRVPEPVYPRGSDPAVDPTYWEPDPTQADMGRRFVVLSIRFLDEDSV